jgi:cardiolipin synthase A/B
MKYRIFTTSEKAWAGMISGIESAHASVYLEMYILDDDSRGVDFFNALEKAARRGVHVILVLDVVGSYDLLSNAVSRLREAGAEVVFCSFFWTRLHRKVLIVDETFAFIGGVNVGKKYAQWRDLQVEVRGTVVRSVTRSFARVYKKCGGKSEIVEATPDLGRLKKTQLWFVDHGIGKRRHLFRKYYEERLDKAQTSITLVTPYLFPPRWFIAHLHQAIIRGVKVDIIMPVATDHWFVNGVNRSFASNLTGLGATCYFTKEMNHAKTMIVDRKEGIIGSQNLDFFSFNFNIEAGVFFHDPRMVEELATIVDSWKFEAKVYHPGAWTLRWYDIPMAFFLRLAGFVPLE